MEKILFSEEQRFTQWWLWLIMFMALSAVVVPFAIGIHSQVVLDKPYGDNPMSTEGLIVTGISSVLLMFFIFMVIAKIRLKTKITAEGLYVSYYPLAKNGKKLRPGKLKNMKFEHTVPSESLAATE